MATFTFTDVKHFRASVFCSFCFGIFLFFLCSFFSFYFFIFFLFYFFLLILRFRNRKWNTSLYVCWFPWRPAITQRNSLIRIIKLLLKAHTAICWMNTVLQFRMTAWGHVSVEALSHCAMLCLTIQCSRRFRRLWMSLHVPLHRHFL